MRANSDDPDRDLPPAAVRRALDRHLSGAAAGEGEVGAEGLALLERERWAEAVETLEEALRLAEREGGAHRVLAVRHDLALALIGSGDLDRAIGLLGPLPDEFAALPEPDEHGRARALESLGDAYLRANRPVAALNFFGQALEILRRLDDPGGQAAMFVRIADAARLRGDGAAERAALDRAAELTRPA
ncbi:tetratricopeptide repeat protein [Actinomadura sp. WMMA1423]|uniref:tetratricopeptide repeat protein n=1 Tax=Actinomadura sp. WMMA1423 TaxID=2591108 RepID=UPI001146D58B|nr:tetratricopeptide repeat protein [Actinomadura sp. WMMA1423]